MEELEENTSNILLKQENLVNGQCLPIKEELEGNVTGILIKQENLDV